MIRNWIRKRSPQALPIQLERLPDETREHGDQPWPAKPSPFADTGSSSKHVRVLLRARQLRAQLFGAHLFADPAWDIVLLAYIATLEQERLLISALCRESIFPATAMLRWVKVLEGDGWLSHHALKDGRNSWLELSEVGKRRIEQYLAMAWPLHLADSCAPSCKPG